MEKSLFLYNGLVRNTINKQEKLKMRKVTRQSIKDADIDIKRVENRLFEIAEAIQINNKNNLTDINVICEEIV